MQNQSHHAARKQHHGSPTTKDYFVADMKNLSAEEMCERANIQSNILDLQSTDSEKVASALNALSIIARLAKRKDALYALVGYYNLEVKTTDEVIWFFDQTKMAFSVHLAVMILNDLTESKDIARRRIFVNDFVKHLSTLFLSGMSDERKEEIRNLIERASWGDKLKRKFLDELFHRRL